MRIRQEAGRSPRERSEFERLAARTGRNTLGSRSFFDFAPLTDAGRSLVVLFRYV
jgi:hypothetical protein